MQAREQNSLRMTEAEYLAFDLASDYRNEYADGYTIVMAGASYNHNRISNNLGTEFNLQLRGKDCDTLQESQRVAIKKKRKTVYRYPDVVIVCGIPQFVKDSAPQTVTNPVLLVEILSPSTASVDTIQKVDEYYQISSVQDYLIVAQDEVRVMHYQRPAQPGKKWSYTDYTTLDDDIELPAIGCTLKLTDIYRRISFDTGDAS